MPRHFHLTKKEQEQRNADFAKITDRIEERLELHKQGGGFHRNELYPEQIHKSVKTGINPGKHRYFERIVEYCEKYGKMLEKKQLWYKIKSFAPEIDYQAFLKFFNKNFEDETQYSAQLNYQYKDKGEKDVVFFTEHFLGLKLHKGQKEWLRETVEKERKLNILCPANQYGKSVLIAIKHIYYCFYKKYLPFKEGFYQTLYLSPRLSQAEQTYNYIVSILRSEFTFFYKGEWMTNHCRLARFLLSPQKTPLQQQISSTPIRFYNKTQVVLRSTSGDAASALAGTQYGLITYDECVYSLHLEEEFGRMVSRVMRLNGDIDFVSTPDEDAVGQQYYLYLMEKGIKKEDGFYTQMGRFDDNIFIDKKTREKFKQSLKATQSTDVYRRIILGEFTKGQTSLWTHARILKMWRDIPFLTKGEGGRYYIIGVDWAMANDYTVFIVIDATTVPYRIAAFHRFRGNEKSPQEQIALLLSIKQDFNDADIVMDITSLGGKILDIDLKDVGAYGITLSHKEKSGLIYSIKKALYYDKNGLETKIIGPRIEQLERELGSYKRNDEKIIQDSVIALGLVLYYLEEQPEPAKPFKLPDSFVY